MSDTETTWDYFIQDFSPLITYSGSSGGKGAGLNAAWNQTCPFEPSGSLNNFLCDVSSVHWTTGVNGASLSIPFYGTSIQLFGNITTGMEYVIEMDGSQSGATPTNQILASVSGLELGNHVLNITAHNAAPGSTLFFEGAAVTVGTGLQGANVTRTVIQDIDPSFSYTSPSWGVQSFDSWNIPHTALNSTWHQIDTGASGSVSSSFTGSAILVYGVGWSFFPTSYDASIDNNTAMHLASNSTLPGITNGVLGHVYTNGLLFFQANLSHGTHSLTLSNDNGVGYFGLDYVEIITITPSNSSGSVAGTNTTPNATVINPPTQNSASPIPEVTATKHTLSLGVIIGPVIGVVMLLFILISYLIYRSRHGRRNSHTRPTPFYATHPEPGLFSTTVVPTPPLFANETVSTMSITKEGYPHIPSVSRRVPTVRTDFTRSFASSDVSTPVEMQAIRRDLDHLLRIVEQQSAIDGPPPEYGSDNL